MSGEEGHQSDTSRAMTSYSTRFERLLFGDRTLQALIRFLAFIALYVVAFGTLFWWLGSAA